MLAIFAETAVSKYAVVWSLVINVVTMWICAHDQSLTAGLVVLR